MSARLTAAALIFIKTSESVFLIGRLTSPGLSTDAAAFFYKGSELMIAFIIDENCLH